MNSNLQIFLYILMRDHLPTGVVRDIMKNYVFECNGQEAVFTNKHLAAMAAEYAADIHRGSKQDPSVLVEMAKQTEWG